METIQWKAKTVYIDQETGEILTELEAKTNYVITKTNKYAYTQNGHGHIEYTNQCKRIYERSLFDTNK